VSATNVWTINQHNLHKEVEYGDEKLHICLESIFLKKTIF